MTFDSDPGPSGPRQRMKIILYATIGSLFVLGGFGLFAAVFTVYAWPRPSNTLLVEVVHGHFRAVVGLPMAAAASFVVVWALSVTEGPIEIEAWGLKFKGAAGPVIFWIFVFLAISTSINLAW